MLKKTAILCAVLGAASLSDSRADNYTETKTAFDAHNLPTAAETLPATAASLTSITGTILLGTQNTSEEDVYRIYISNPAAFSATTNANIIRTGAGQNNFDTQIFLFNSNMQGVLENDDTAGGGSGGGTAVESTIPAGSLSGPAGYFYLAIAGAETLPSSSPDNPPAGGNSIFPNTQEDGGNGYQTTTVATAKFAGVFNAYNSTANPSGNYLINLTGATFAAPEPSSIALMAAGAAGAAGVYLRRKR